MANLLNIRKDIEMLERAPVNHWRGEYVLNLLTSMADCIEQLQRDRNEARGALTSLVHGDVGRATLIKLSHGQGTATADGKAWLHAAELVKLHGTKWTEDEAAAHIAADDSDGDMNTRRLTALWRYGRDLLPIGAPSFEGFLFALDSHIDRVCPRPSAEPDLCEGCPS